MQRINLITGSLSLASSDDIRKVPILNAVAKIELGSAGRAFIGGNYEYFAGELSLGGELTTYVYVLPAIIYAEIDFSEGAVYAYLPSPLETFRLDNLYRGYLDGECWEPFFRYVSRYIESSHGRFLLAEILDSDDTLIPERVPRENYTILRLESPNKSFVHFVCYWGVDWEEIWTITSCCDIGSDCYGLLVENAEARRLESGTVVSVNYLRSLCRASDVVYASVCDHESRIFWEREGFSAPAGREDL